jgi:hypothetical protein
MCNTLCQGSTARFSFSSCRNNKTGGIIRSDLGHFGICGFHLSRLESHESLERLLVPAIKGLKQTGLKKNDE